jgi:Zn-dependent peptidase ImmA (M78 family)
MVSNTLGAIITNIKLLVQKLIKYFNTNNPFEIADQLGILILYKPFKKLKGCYKLIKRRKVIFLSSFLDHDEKRVVCAHELGHAIMHPKTNCKFLQNYTLLSVKKIEIEANKFCAFLLITDDMITEHEGFTHQQISQTLYIPLEIVKLRQA